MIARPRRPWYRRYAPGWVVSGGGGSGGASTVQTDGVTIQGDGTAGNKIAIKAVQTQARLSGAGTVASPLDVAGWPVPGFLTYARDVNAQTCVTNRVSIWALTIGYPVTFSKIGFWNSTGDAVNNVDFGLYNSAGTLIANIGAQIVAGSTFQAIATVQGSQTIAPGLYFYAITSNASVFAFFEDTGCLCLYQNNSYAASAGGALPASITPPTLAINRFGPIMALL